MSYHIMPQFEMALGVKSVPVKKAVKAERPKACKSLRKLPRYDELPDEIRYAMRLRDYAFMESVMS